MCLYESLHTDLSAHMHADRLIWWLNILWQIHSCIHPCKHSDNWTTTWRIDKQAISQMCVCVHFVSIFHPLIPLLFSSTMRVTSPLYRPEPISQFNFFILLSSPRLLVHYTSNLTFTPSTLTSVYPPAVQISVLEKLIFISFLSSIISIIQTVTCWTFNDVQFSISTSSTFKATAIFALHVEQT